MYETAILGGHSEQSTCRESQGGENKLRRTCSDEQLYTIDIQSTIYKLKGPDEQLHGSNRAIEKVSAGSAGQVNYSGWLRDLIVVYNRI